MSNYRILLKRQQIEKTPRGNGQRLTYDRSRVTRSQALWGGDSPPPPETIEAAVTKAQLAAEDRFNPMLNPSWRLRPAVLSETILLQQQRTPKILGWKTLQLAEVTALAEDGLQEALTFDDPQPGLAKRVLAFIMDNDPVLHASKR